MLILERLPAQIPGSTVDVGTDTEKCLLCLLGNIQQVEVIFFAVEGVDLNKFLVGFQATGGLTAFLDIQLRRHGNQLVEIDGAKAVFVILDGLKQGFDTVRVALDLDDICHMVWHENLQ